MHKLVAPQRDQFRIKCHASFFDSSVFLLITTFLIVERIQFLSGIVPPSVWRAVVDDVEFTRSLWFRTPPLFGQQSAHKLLKSRRSFLDSTSELQVQPALAKLDNWNNISQDLQGWVHPRGSCQEVRVRAGWSGGP